MMGHALRLLLILLPWPARRQLYRWLYGYQIDRTARIGLAWIYPRQLVMGPGSRIGHATVCKGLERLELGERASIGRGNWITAFPAGHARHFAHQSDRAPELILEAHSAITNRHIIDCTHRIRIGRYATVAGFRSQLLTHSIDIHAGRQSSAPILIGAYSFTGTGCIILGGGELPDYSVLGAGAVLNRSFAQPYRLYAGVPAKEAAELPSDARYFDRQVGYVD